MYLSDSHSLHLLVLVSLHPPLSVSPSICLSVCLSPSICMSVCLSPSMCLLISLSTSLCTLICPAINLSVFFFIHLLVCLFIHLSVCFFHPSVIHVSICLSLLPSVFFLSICQYVFKSICVAAYLFIHLSFSLHLSGCLCFFLFIHLSVCLSPFITLLSVCLFSSIYQSISSRLKTQQDNPFSNSWIHHYRNIEPRLVIGI